MYNLWCPTCRKDSRSELEICPLCGKKAKVLGTVLRITASNGEFKNHVQQLTITGAKIHLMTLRAVLSKTTTDKIKSKLLSPELAEITFDVYITPQQFAELINQTFDKEVTLEVKNGQINCLLTRNAG